MPNRSASARALGRSLSHRATSSTPRIFDSTGRCATCAMAPAPTTPMRSGAVVTRPSTRSATTCGSLDRANRRPGVVGAKDRAEVLARARSPDRAALAHAHTVPIAAALQGQTLHTVPAGHDVDGKVGAEQQLASGRSQRGTDLVSA